MSIVEIEHKDGRRYRIEKRHFSRRKMANGKTYQELGFKITRNADDTIYVETHQPELPESDETEQELVVPIEETGLTEEEALINPVDESI